MKRTATVTIKVKAVVTISPDDLGAPEDEKAFKVYCAESLAHLIRAWLDTSPRVDNGALADAFVEQMTHRGVDL